MSGLEGEVFDPVLLNTFVIRKKRCRVYFHRGTLTWESEGALYGKYTKLFTEHGYRFYDMSQKCQFCTALLKWKGVTFVTLLLSRTSGLQVRRYLKT
jgi:hypothetical protein